MIFDKLLDLGETDIGANDGTLPVHISPDTIWLRQNRDLWAGNVGHQLAFRFECTESFVGGVGPPPARLNMGVVFSDTINTYTAIYSGGPGLTPWLIATYLIEGNVWYLPVPPPNFHTSGDLIPPDGSAKSMYVAYINEMSTPWGIGTENWTAGKMKASLVRTHGNTKIYPAAAGNA